MLPGSIVFFLIDPAVVTFSMYLVVIERAFVIAAIFEGDQSYTVLFTCHPFSFVFLIVWPKHNPFSFGGILPPTSLIDCTVRVSVYSLSIRLVVFKFPLVDASICEFELTLAMAIIKLPLSGIYATVSPFHCSLAM